MHVHFLVNSLSPQTSVPEPTDEPTVEIIPTLKPTRKVRHNAVEFVID
jgi:hypothetical protein